jgi:hypothetical protein
MGDSSPEEMAARRRLALEPYLDTPEKIISPAPRRLLSKEELNASWKKQQKAAERAKAEEAERIKAIRKKEIEPLVEQLIAPVEKEITSEWPFEEYTGKLYKAFSYFPKLQKQYEMDRKRCSEIFQGGYSEPMVKSHNSCMNQLYVNYVFQLRNEFRTLFNIKGGAKNTRRNSKKQKRTRRNK